MGGKEFRREEAIELRIARGQSERERADELPWCVPEIAG